MTAQKSLIQQASEVAAKLREVGSTLRSQYEIHFSFPFPVSWKDVELRNDFDMIGGMPL